MKIHLFLLQKPSGGKRLQTAGKKQDGNPVDRSNIWTEMKKVAEKAGVALEKAFPHNLRHFFARTYYNMHKNISYLADILGHSSINTTRIYTATTEENHVKMLECLELVV
mgnify:CR=1 FL=1